MDKNKYLKTTFIKKLFTFILPMGSENEIGGSEEMYLNYAIHKNN